MPRQRATSKHCYHNEAPHTTHHQHRHGKTSGHVRSKMSLGKKQVILSRLEMGLVNWVVSRAVFFHMNFFFKYLAFGKSCNKLLCIKYITLNSPLI